MHYKFSKRISQLATFGLEDANALFSIAVKLSVGMNWIRGRRRMFLRRQAFIENKFLQGQQEYFAQEMRLHLQFFVDSALLCNSFPND
jgi:hypothetical protein